MIASFILVHVEALFDQWGAGTKGSWDIGGQAALDEPSERSLRRSHLEFYHANKLFPVRHEEGAFVKHVWNSNANNVAPLTVTLSPMHQEHELIALTVSNSVTPCQESLKKGGRKSPLSYLGCTIDSRQLCLSVISLQSQLLALFQLVLLTHGFCFTAPRM